MAAKPPQMIPIPNYHQACLAAATTDPSGQSFYLVGSSTLGFLDILFMSDIFTPEAKYIGNQSDVGAWNIEARKACFGSPSSKDANAPIKITQFGMATTAMTIAYPNGTIEPKDLNTRQPSSFLSPKLFAWSGQMTDYNLYTVFTNHFEPGFSPWVANLQTYKATDTGSLNRYDISHFPTATPLLALGTYTPSTGTTSSGYTIVFDTAGQGMVYITAGNSMTNDSSPIPPMTLSPGAAVNMNNIVLTENAIPITMTTTGYILDMAKDNFSTVIYSITPGKAYTLQQVFNTSSPPPFANNMAAAAVGQTIITYTSSLGASAYFNRFDTITGRWTGNNRVTSLAESEKSSPIGAIVGGVLGGLIVIAIATIFFLRNRRQKARKLAFIPEPEVGTIIATSTTDDIDGSGLGYVQYAPPYPLPPSFIPPPPPFSSIRDNNITKDYDPAHNGNYSLSAQSDLTVLDPTNPYCPSYISPNSYRDSQTTQTSYMVPNSPEMCQVKPRKSSGSLCPSSPQYIPNRTMDEGFVGRPPQAIVNTPSDGPATPSMSHTPSCIE